MAGRDKLDELQQENKALSSTVTFLRDRIDDLERANYTLRSEAEAKTHSRRKPVEIAQVLWRAFCQWREGLPFEGNPASAEVLNMLTLRVGDKMLQEIMTGL